MKVKIELLPHEHPEDADEFLEKALKAKHDCTDGEKYSDEWLNKLHDDLLKMHAATLEQIESEIRQEIERHAR